MTSFTKIKHAVEQISNSYTVGGLLNKEFYLTTLYYAQLSYFHDDVIIDALNKRMPLDISIHRGNGTKAFIAEFSDATIVSFRGTFFTDGSRDNILTSFKFWPTKYKDVRVHRGYLNALKQMMNPMLDVIDKLDTSKRLVYVGHSLGGALATLLAITHAPTDLCTYGAPRVGMGMNLNDHFDGVNYQRVADFWDWIRLLPPYIPLIMPYKHYGHERVLCGDFNIRQPLAAHGLGSYLELLTQAEL